MDTRIFSYMFISSLGILVGSETRALRFEPKAEHLTTWAFFRFSLSFCFRTWEWEPKTTNALKRQPISRYTSICMQILSKRQYQLNIWFGGVFGPLYIIKLNHHLVLWQSSFSPKKLRGGVMIDNDSTTKKLPRILCCRRAPHRGQPLRKLM